MYDFLRDFASRPAPFSRYTTRTLWTSPHLARQMLQYHLDPDTDLASRRPSLIEATAHWIDSQLDLSGKSLCDLGCGPGLYADRFAAAGAKVTGVDFSRHSLDHARLHTAPGISYLEADYLEDTLPRGFDVVTLIYEDYGALSPPQRQQLLGNIQKMLNPGGHLVLDAPGRGHFAQRDESTVMEPGLMGGFFSAGNYIGLQKTFLYPGQQLVLDRYAIIEEAETWELFNWTQCFTAEQLTRDLASAGFTVEMMTSDLTGSPVGENSLSLAVIASQ